VSGAADHARSPSLTIGPVVTPREGTSPGVRVMGLDGLRGLLALYVVMFHCWLYTVRGFPANPGPVWLGWLLYGRLAVVFFLLLSGFSLALSAAANGWHLGGLARFLRRRAWRIVPPYWAALVFSLVIAWRWPWPWLAALAAAPVLTLMIAKGSVWTVEHYFWIDLAVAPAMALLLVAMATGRPVAMVRLLTTRAARGLGGFSYSLYLIHLPIIMVIGRGIAPHVVGRGLPAFWFTLVLGVPISVLAARLFSLAFELPFQRHRSWAALLAALRSRGRHRSKRLPERAIRLCGPGTRGVKRYELDGWLQDPSVPPDRLASRP
jgi:peptidoglycan/LPS O-acetylase OafA/YrhL